MEQFDNKSLLTARALETLKKEYVVIGKRRVRSWHAWLALGVVVGITIGIVLVANNSGRFNPSEAAAVCGNSPSCTITFPTVGTWVVKVKITDGLGKTAIAYQSVAVGSTGGLEPPPQPITGSNCYHVYAGIHDTPGAEVFRDAGKDYRFLCSNDRWFSCGIQWPPSGRTEDAPWGSTATNGQHISSWFCDLPNSQWTRTQPPPPPSNNAACVSHTIPSTMTAGQLVPVTVTFGNTGTAMWDVSGWSASGYGAVMQPWPPANPFTPNAFTFLGNVAPGANGTASFTLTAPPAPGAYSGIQYRMIQQGVELFGPNCGPDNITVTSPPNNASCSGITAPASVTAGQVFSATVTMSNSGTKPWTTDPTPHNLGSQNPQDNLRWGLGRVALPFQPVNPGQNAAFSFSPTAPSTAGTYPFDWKMVEDGIEWFGATCTQTITVNPPQSNLVIDPLPAPVPASPVEGQLVTFSGVVRNTGDASTGVTSQTRLRVDGTQINPDQTTSALAPTGTETETWTNLWTATAGTHTFEICADATGAVSESNEGDNCSPPRTFTVSRILNARISASKDNGVNWSRNSISGIAPLNDVDLRTLLTTVSPARVNYTFYCHNPNPGVGIDPGYVAKYDSVSMSSNWGPGLARDARIAGVIGSIIAGDGLRVQVDATNNRFYVYDACDYTPAGTYVPKVIAERSSNQDQDRMGVGVVVTAF